jgi:hypothetical protein
MCGERGCEDGEECKEVVKMNMSYKMHWSVLMNIKLYLIL